MTLYEYNALDKPEQSESLWEFGVHIGERDENNIRYILYALDSFYVELKYNKKLNVINSSRSFSSTTQLEPYLHLIDISKITL